MKSAMKHVFGILATVAAAATLGLVTAPKPLAASTEMTGWTCFEWDVCHSGSLPCCWELADVKPGQGRCSTICGES